LRFTYCKFAEHPGISLLDVCEFSFNVLNFFNTLFSAKYIRKIQRRFTQASTKIQTNNLAANFITYSRAIN
jgi:hypothetical protein